MAAVSQSAAARVGRTPRLQPLAFVGAALFAAGCIALGRSSGLGDPARVQEFVLVFSSIVIEALPFILVGALVSSLLAVYVSDRMFARIGRLPLHVQIPGAMACAVAFPVCECASVPMARRLIGRGVHPAAGLAFMLAAPVVNPVVLASTWIAYSGSGRALEMTLGRFVVGVVVAGAAGLLLRRSVRPAAQVSSGHGHDHAGEPRLSVVAGHVAGDFFFMGKFLVLGAAVAASAQTFVPRSLLENLGGMAILAPLAMMALAVILSLCSEADAFVAASFSSFSPGSQLAFLAIGPIYDAKLAMLYAGTFKRWFGPALLAIAVPITLLASVIFESLLR